MCLIVFAWQLVPGAPLVAAASRREEGNLFYKVHQSNAAANTLVLFEGYADAAAVEAHRHSDHFQQLVVGKIIPQLEAREVILASEINVDV